MPSQLSTAADTASQSGTGDNWTNPDDAKTENVAYATMTGAVDSVSRYLVLTGYNFTIPGGARIDGIVASIRRKTDDVTETNPIDNSLVLFYGGAVYSGDRSEGMNYPFAEAYSDWGGSTDLWDVTWTPAQINDSTFGIGMKCQDQGSIGGWIGSVNNVNITVYYTLNGAPQMMMMGVGI